MYFKISLLFILSVFAVMIPFHYQPTQAKLLPDAQSHPNYMESGIVLNLNQAQPSYQMLSSAYITNTISPTLIQLNRPILPPHPILQTADWWYGLRDGNEHPNPVFCHFVAYPNPCYITYLPILLR